MSKSYLTAITRNKPSATITYLKNHGFINEIQNLLSENGVAYISVRRDLPNQELYTKKGTYQRMVYLDHPIVYELKSRYCIYRLNKE